MAIGDEFAQPQSGSAPIANKPPEARTRAGKAINEPDQEVRALLRQILFETRRQNRILSIVNNIEIPDSDVED